MAQQRAGLWFLADLHILCINIFSSKVPNQGWVPHTTQNILETFIWIAGRETEGWNFPGTQWLMGAEAPPDALLSFRWLSLAETFFTDDGRAVTMDHGGKKTNNNNTLIFLLHCSLVSQIHLLWRTQFIILPLPGWEIKENKYICRHAYPHAYTQHRVYKRDHLRTREGQNLLFFLQVLRFISRDAWLAWNWLLITAFCICFLLQVFNILKKRQRRGKQVQRQGSLRDQLDSQVA